jgi:NADH:ubiquinone oxidoreductase subunit E
MLQSDQERLRDEVVELAESYGNERHALLPILQEVQRRHSYVSEYAMQVIADQLGIHPVEVYSVVSFYSFLKHHPNGDFVFRLCKTVSCEMAGKDRVARQLEADLGISFGETTPDGRFTLEWTPCLGMCDQGPALLVNDEMHTRVTPGRVHEIVEECRSRFGVHALQEEEH